MKNRYRRFKRSWGVYFAFDTLTGNSKSLKTRDRKVADRPIEAKNEAEREVGLRKKIGLIYLTAADPQCPEISVQFPRSSHAMAGECPRDVRATSANAVTSFPRPVRKLTVAASCP
jgi:hypothetical protein